MLLGLTVPLAFGVLNAGQDAAGGISSWSRVEVFGEARSSWSRCGLALWSFGRMWATRCHQRPARLPPGGVEVAAGVRPEPAGAGGGVGPETVPGMDLEKRVSPDHRRRPGGQRRALVPTAGATPTGQRSRPAGRPGVRGAARHRLPVQQIGLEPGDRLVLLTDGMRERNAVGAPVADLLADRGDLGIPARRSGPSPPPWRTPPTATFAADATVLILHWYGGPD